MVKTTEKQMAFTKDGYTLVDADTTTLLEQTDKAKLYRLCTAYTYRDFVLRFEVSNNETETVEVFKTEADARTAYNKIT
jgi:predicted kinase